MEMKYRRKRFTKNPECGIWSFDRRGPKGAPRIFARCSKCGQVNDMTGGVFIATYRDGKCTSARSGCAACRFCGRSFSEWVFEQWVPALAFLTTDNYSFGGKSPAEIAKAVSTFKGYGYAHLYSNVLGMGMLAAYYGQPIRSGQISYHPAHRWAVSAVSLNNPSQKSFDDFNEAIAYLVGYLHEGTLVKPAPASAVV